MTSTCKDFSARAPGEIDNFSLDFSDQIAAGETLVAATWALSSASDGSASSRLNGSTAFTTGGLTTQSITVAVPGTYLAIATATTSTGRVLILDAHLPCVTPT